MRVATSQLRRTNSCPLITGRPQSKLSKQELAINLIFQLDSLSILNRDQVIAAIKQKLLFEDNSSYIRINDAYLENFKLSSSVANQVLSACINMINSCSETLEHTEIVTLINQHQIYLNIKSHIVDFLQNADTQEKLAISKKQLTDIGNQISYYNDYHACHSTLDIIENNKELFTNGSPFTIGLVLYIKSIDKSVNLQQISALIQLLQSVQQLLERPEAKGLQDICKSELISNILNLKYANISSSNKPVKNTFPFFNSLQEKEASNNLIKDFMKNNAKLLDEIIKSDIILESLVYKINNLSQSKLNKLGTRKEILTNFTKENPQFDLSTPAGQLAARQNLSQKITIGLKKLIDSLPDPSKYWQVFREALANATHAIRIKLFGSSENNILSANEVSPRKIIAQDSSTTSSSLTKRILADDTLVAAIATKEIIEEGLRQASPRSAIQEFSEKKKVDQYYSPLTPEKINELQELYELLSKWGSSSILLKQQYDELRKFLFALNLASIDETIFPSNPDINSISKIVDTAKKILKRFKLQRGENQHPLYQRDLQLIFLCLINSLKLKSSAAEEVKRAVLKGEIKFLVEPVENSYLTNMLEGLGSDKVQLDTMKQGYAEYLNYVDKLTAKELDLCLDILQHYTLKGLQNINVQAQEDYTILEPQNYAGKLAKVYSNTKNYINKWFNSYDNSHQLPINLRRKLHRYGRPADEPFEKDLIILSEDSAQRIRETFDKDENKEIREALANLNYNTFEIYNLFHHVCYKKYDSEGQESSNGSEVKFWLESPILMLLKSDAIKNQYSFTPMGNQLIDQLDFQLRYKYSTVISGAYHITLPTYKEYEEKKELIEKTIKEQFWHQEVECIAKDGKSLITRKLASLNFTTQRARNMRNKYP